MDEFPPNLLKEWGSSWWTTVDEVLEEALERSSDGWRRSD